MGRLDATATLATSTRYGYPEQTGELLPVVYGDMRIGGEGGLMRAVLIDTVHNVYCCCNHVAYSIDSVWSESGAPIVSGFTASLSNNYESQGTIATLTFTTAQTGGIYWRGRGVASGGSLLTSPMDCWQDFLATHLGWAAYDFEPTSWAKALADCAVQGYGFARWIHEERTVRSWLAEWAGDILAEYWLDRQDRLVVQLDTGAGAQDGDLAGHIYAARDCVDGDAGMTMVHDAQNIVNVLRQYHLYHPRRGDYSSVVEATHAASRNSYGDMGVPVTYPTVRSTAHLAAVSAILLSRFNGMAPPKAGMVTARTAGTKFLHLTRGDLVGLSWDRGPAVAPDRYYNRIARVQNITTQLPSGPITITALDLGQRLYADQYFDADGGDAAGYFDAEIHFGGIPDLALRP